MDFRTLYRKISPNLKRIAESCRSNSLFFDADDLYQEMSIHLWKKFKDGTPTHLNNAYIIRGCRFHILNYLRKEREKATTLSLEKPINASGDRLADVLADTKEPFSSYMDRKLTLDEIRNNGFTRREKEVFAHLLEGLTVREVGEKLGISHVMVVKYKNRIIKKWRRKNKGYQRQQRFT